MADMLKRIPVREQDAKVRATNFEEVCLGYNGEEAKEEAIRLKAVMNDNTLNMLTKYVYKILGVYNLNCNYDINEEKCRCCNRKILNLKREENIDE